MAQWVLQGGCGQIQPTGWVAATAGQICLQIPVLITELPDLTIPNYTNRWDRGVDRLVVFFALAQYDRVYIQSKTNLH